MSKTEIVRTYEQCNDIIRMHRDSYVEAGQCLATVRDLGLYKSKGGYETFEEYCKSEWGWSRSYAFRIIGAAELASRLLPVGNIQNAKKAEITQNSVPPERALREVLVATDDPKKQDKVWKAAVAKAESNGKPVTAATVKAVAAELLGPRQPAREPGEDPPEPEHVEPPKPIATPFDEPLAGVDFVLKVAVPKMQEFAILAERALGSGKGDFSAAKIGKLAAIIHAEFEGIRGVLKNAQSKAAKAK